MKDTASSREGGIGESFAGVIRSLKGVLLSLYRLFPAAAMGLLGLAAFVGFFASKSELAAQAIALVVVFTASAIVFVAKRSYAEALLTLVVGLLPALSMTWSVGRFWVFVGGFFLLGAFCLLATSLRLARDAEEIYKQAANFAKREDATIDDKQLEKLAKSANAKTLGPIERAECVRQLKFRNFPTTLLPAALKSIETMSVVTGLPAHEIASYLVILYPLVDATGRSFSMLDDGFYTTLRDSAATPEEFFEAFRMTRSLVLEKKLPLDKYLRELAALLGYGLPPQEIRSRMEATLGEIA